jgi:RNA polymerase sigma-70 factor, ECF subfamily
MTTATAILSPRLDLGTTLALPDLHMLERRKPMADQDLVERLTAGDSAAWRQVFSEYGPRLLGYATRMLGDRSMAEEVVQDSLVSAYKSIGRFQGRSGLKTWLFRVVHNRAIDELRRRKRFVHAPDDDPEPAYFNEAGKWTDSCPKWGERAEEQLDAQRKLARVRVELDKLPHNYREVILLKEVHGLDTSEICEALDISPGNLRIRLHRARKALRAAVVHGQED